MNVSKIINNVYIEIYTAHYKIYKIRCFLRISNIYHLFVVFLVEFGFRLMFSLGRRSDSLICLEMAAESGVKAAWQQQGWDSVGDFIAN